MTRLQAALEDYITIRRTMGFKFEDSAKLLSGFVAQLEHDGSQVITSVAAVAWATAAGGHPNWWGKRLSMVRGFARYLQSLDSMRSRRRACSRLVPAAPRRISIARTTSPD